MAHRWPTNDIVGADKQRGAIDCAVAQIHFVAEANQTAAMINLDQHGLFDDDDPNEMAQEVRGEITRMLRSAGLTPEQVQKMTPQVRTSAYICSD